MNYEHQYFKYKKKYLESQSRFSSLYSKLSLINITQKNVTGTKINWTNFFYLSDIITIINNKDEDYDPYFEGIRRPIIQTMNNKIFTLEFYYSLIQTFGETIINQFFEYYDITINREDFQITIPVIDVIYQSQEDEKKEEDQLELSPIKYAEQDEFNRFLIYKENPIYRTQYFSHSRIPKDIEPIPFNCIYIKNFKDRNFIFEVLYHYKNGESTTPLQNLKNFYDRQKIDHIPEKIKEITSFLEDTITEKWIQIGYAQIEIDVFTEEKRIKVHISYLFAGSTVRGGGNHILCLVMKYLQNKYKDYTFIVDLLSTDAENVRAYKNMGFYQIPRDESITGSSNYKLNLEIFNKKCLDNKLLFDNVEFYIQEIN
jgi:hypothetical protein